MVLIRCSQMWYYNVDTTFLLFQLLLFLKLFEFLLNVVYILYSNPLPRLSLFFFSVVVYICIFPCTCVSDSRSYDPVCVHNKQFVCYISFFFLYFLFFSSLFDQFIVVTSFYFCFFLSLLLLLLPLPPPISSTFKNPFSINVVQYNCNTCKYDEKHHCTNKYNFK